MRHSDKFVLTPLAAAVSRTAFLAAVIFLFAACGGDGPTKTAAVETVTVSAASTSLVAGGTVQLQVTLSDASGKQLSGREVAWSTSNASLATVSAQGLVTAVNAGSVRITATSETKTGSVNLTIAPPPVASVEITASSQTLIISEQLALVVTLRDSRGNTLSGRPIIWSSGNTSVAVVSTTGTVTALSAGSATITARSEGRSGTVDLTVIPFPDPEIISVPALQATMPAVITGRNFDPQITGNSVTIGGETARIEEASPTSLTVIVPCIPGGDADVRVTRGSQQSNVVSAAVSTPQRGLTVGEPVVLSSSDADCVGISPLPSDARLLVMVANTATDLNSTIALRVTGRALGTESVRMVDGTPSPFLQSSDIFAASDEDSRRERVHMAHLEREREMYRTMGAPRPQNSRRGTSVSGDARSDLPQPGDMRSFFIGFSFGCSTPGPAARSKAIYVGSKAIIWEDEANTLQSADNSDLADYYQRIGEIFDNEQYDVIKDNFGDPLLRDAETDGDGRLHMVFSQKINAISGVAAYVTSCDQYPVSQYAGSNANQVFYATVPVNAGSNINSSSYPDGWFYFMGRTVIHEVKHIASHSARMANNASAFEESWLEEGSARMAEEMWVRPIVHQTAWKGNAGWSGPEANGLYCDFHPADATCNSVDPLHRPTYGMRRQFNEIRPKLLQPWEYSPYGQAEGQTGSVFYNTTWSLLRYILDRYATTEASFLTAFNNATNVGVTNLQDKSGKGIDEIIVNWGLALYADDYPDMPKTNPDPQFQTWNLRSIYAGLNASPTWRGTWSTPFPIQPVQVPFGTFQANVITVRSGAHAYYEVSGGNPGPLTLRVRSSSGGVLNSSIRLAILRLK